MRIAGLVVTALLAASARSQVPTVDLWQLPVAERVAALRADAESVRIAFEQLHPGLFRYLNGVQWRSKLRALELELERAPTMPGAYLAFSKLANTLRCGHTYCNFFNQPRAIQDSLFRAVPHLPFRFRWLGERMVVLRDLDDPSRLPPGTEIRSIDGVPAADLLTSMMSIARADGGNDAKRRDYLSVTGGSEFEAFDVYLPLLFPEMRGPYRLETRTPSGESRRLEVAAISHAERTKSDREAAIPAVEVFGQDAGQEGFTWSRGDDLAILRMRGWALFDSKWDWAAWLDRRMDEAVRAKTPNLVIDLRGNEGGLDCGDGVLARLAAESLPARDVNPFVRYRKTPPDLDPLLDTWDSSFRDWGEFAVEAPAPKLLGADKGSWFRLTRYDDELSRGIVPKAERYPGRVFVLVDAACSSATFQFAATVKRHRLGTLVGQTTGGNQRGINGGAFFFLRLPNSHIEIDLPLIAGVPNGDAPDAGIAPDVEVTPTVADISAGVDREMATVRELIGRSR